MIHLLTQSVLRGAGDESAPLAVLVRLVRERDGSIDALVADFEARARSASSDAGPHLALGHLYRESGRFDAALREYTEAERIAPSSPAAPRAAGALYRRMGRSAEARAALERALARTQDRRAQADTLRQLMDLALEARDVSAARGYHQRLLALDRTSGTVRRELADALLTRQLWAEAVSEFQSLTRALAGDNRVLPRVLLDLGRAYAGNRQLTEAEQSYRRALSLAGSDAGIRREIYDAITELYVARNQLPAWIAELERAGGSDGYTRAVLLARLHEQSGNAPAAIAAYRRALAFRSGDLDVHLRLAQLYRQQGARDDEIAEYRRLVALAPREPRFVTELADLVASQGHRDEAQRLLRQASARAGADPGMHEQLAGAFARLGFQQDAQRETELVARLDPQSPAGLVALGRMQMEAGQRDRALATWRRILDGARDRARGAQALAEVYADNDMLDQAIDMYGEAIRLRPDDVSFHQHLASVLERARRFDAAIEEWRRVIALATNDRDARRHAREAIVRLWALQGRLESQILALAALVEREPTNLEAARDLAEAQVRARHYEEAARVLRSVIDRDRSDVASMVVLERVLTQLGRRGDAIEVLRRLVEADPRRAREYYDAMARHAMALHRDEQAIEFATRAIALNDQDATAHLRLAELYRARNDLSGALASLRRALELNDRLYQTYFELADLYLGFRDDPRAALDLYRRVIALAPSDDDVNRAGRQAIQVAPAVGLGAEVERDLAAASAQAPTRAVFRRLLVAYYDAYARPLINRVQQGSPEEAVRARRDLSAIGARALAPLLAALSDNDQGQQRVALDILGYLGNPNAASALVAVAEGNGDADIRRRALAAAGALANPRVLPRLIALQTSAADPRLATIATWAIAHLRTPAASAALVRVLAPGYPAEVRAMAALGLAGARDPGVRARLRALLEPSNETPVRAAAAYAIGAGADRATLAALAEALETGPVPLRVAAAAALGRCGEPSAVAGPLARALFSPSVEVRRAAARALVQLAGGAHDAAAQAFDEPSHSHSSQALLAAMIDPPGVPIDGAAAVVRFREEIAAAAREALSGMVERAQIALAALGERGALVPLVRAETTRAHPGAASALTDVMRAAVPALSALLTHPSLALRRSALRVLAEAPAAEAVLALARGVGDQDEDVAAEALEALARRRDNAAALEAVRARLALGTSWTLRASAATVLGTMDDARAASCLIETLREDPFEYVRVAAARALGEHLARPGVREALARAAREDGDASVREAARQALEREDRVRAEAPPQRP